MKRSFALVLLAVGLSVSCSNREPPPRGSCGKKVGEQEFLTTFRNLVPTALGGDFRGARAFVGEAFERCDRQAFVDMLEELSNHEEDPERHVRIEALLQYARHADFMESHLARMDRWHQEDRGCDDPMGYGVVAQAQFRTVFADLLAGDSTEEGAGATGSKADRVERGFWLGVHVLLRDDRRYYRAKIIEEMMSQLILRRPDLLDAFFLALRTRGIHVDLDSMALVRWRSRDEVRRTLAPATAAAFLSEAILVADLDDDGVDLQGFADVKQALVAGWSHLPKARRDRFLRSLKDASVLTELVDLSRKMDEEGARQ